MNVESWPIIRVIPYARNPRKNAVAVAKVAASLKEFGWRQPIVVDPDGVIVVGHTRWLAAQQLGLTEVPVHVAEGLTPAQVKAYRLADNRTNEEAEWDEALLAGELEELKDVGFDLALTGFDGDELVELLGAAGEQLGLTDEDAAPALQETPISVRGDVWLCAGHRVTCGDATALCDVERLLAGVQADALWTDPPYNVAYVGKTKDALTIQNDKMTDAQFLGFLADVFTTAAVALKEGAPAYVAHADTEGVKFRMAFTAAGFHMASCLIWRKNTLVLGHSDYHWQHEPILYGWKAGAAHRWYGARNKTTMQELDGPPYQRISPHEVHVTLGETTLVIRGADIEVDRLAGTVFYEDKPSRSSEHPTMKPVALIERMLANSTQRQDVVLDLFGGSGSTLIACQKLGRFGYLLELDPRFVDVIVRRWQDFTGKPAVLERDGGTFAEVERARRAAAEIAAGADAAPEVDPGMDPDVVAAPQIPAEV